MLLQAAVDALADDDVRVLDAGFEIRQLQAAGATRYVKPPSLPISPRASGANDAVHRPPPSLRALLTYRLPPLRLPELAETRGLRIWNNRS